MKLYHLYFYPVEADEDTLPLFGEEDEYPIGVFSSHEKAMAVAETLKTKPGFRKWPGGFRVLVSTLDPEDYGFKEGIGDIEDEDGGELHNSSSETPPLAP